MAEGETTGAAEFSGAQLDAIAGVVQRIVDKAFSERSSGVAAGGSEGGSAGAGRASAEGTTTAQTGESEQLVPTAGGSCILLPARGRRRSGEKREGSRRGRQRASRSQRFLLFSPGVQVHHGTCHIKVGGGGTYTAGGTYLMLIYSAASMG